MAKSSIFLNGSIFTSDGKTIAAVMEAVQAHGWTYDQARNVFLPPGHDTPSAAPAHSEKENDDDDQA